MFFTAKLNSTTVFMATLALFITGCNQENITINNASNQGIPIKFLVGSDLAEFCQQAAAKLNPTKPKLSNGKLFYLGCEAKGSGRKNH